MVLLIVLVIIGLLSVAAFGLIGFILIGSAWNGAENGEDDTEDICR